MNCIGILYKMLDVDTPFITEIPFNSVFPSIFQDDMHPLRGCSLTSFQIIIFSHEFVPLHLEKVQIIPKLLYFIDLYTV